MIGHKVLLIHVSLPAQCRVNLLVVYKIKCNQIHLCCRLIPGLYGRVSNHEPFEKNALLEPGGPYTCNLQCLSMQASSRHPISKALAYRNYLISTIAAAMTPAKFWTQQNSIFFWGHHRSKLLIKPCSGLALWCKSLLFLRASLFEGQLSRGSPKHPHLLIQVIILLVSPCENDSRKKGKKKYF